MCRGESWKYIINIIIIIIRMARWEGVCLQRSCKQHCTIVINVKRALFSITIIIDGFISDKLTFSWRDLDETLTGTWFYNYRAPYYYYYYYYYYGLYRVVLCILKYSFAVAYTATTPHGPYTVEFSVPTVVTTLFMTSQPAGKPFKWSFRQFIHYYFIFFTLFIPSTR